MHKTIFCFLVGVFGSITLTIFAAPFIVIPNLLITEIFRLIPGIIIVGACLSPIYLWFFIAGWTIYKEIKIQ